MVGEELILADVGAFILFLMVSLLLFVCVLWAITIRKSKQYRKELADMYVASKIKKLAKDDGLDIIEEFESFKKWNKRQRLTESNYELDDYVEAGLNERVMQEKQSKK